MLLAVSYLAFVAAKLYISFVVNDDSEGELIIFPVPFPHSRPVFPALDQRPQPVSFVSLPYSFELTVRKDQLSFSVFEVAVPLPDVVSMRVFIVVDSDVGLFALCPGPIVDHFPEIVLEIRQFSNPVEESSQEIPKVDEPLETTHVREDVEPHPIHTAILPLPHIPISVGKYMNPVVILDRPVGISGFTRVVLVLSLKLGH